MRNFNASWHRFLINVGRFWAPRRASKSTQNRPKIDLGRPWRSQGRPRPAQDPPKTAQERPKIIPRPAKIDPRRLSNAYFSKIVIVQKSLKNLWKITVFEPKGRPRTTQDRPKTAPRRPKSDPRPPKSDSRPPKSDPRQPKSDPRSSKTIPRAAKSDYTLFPRAKTAPRGFNKTYPSKNGKRAKG